MASISDYCGMCGSRESDYPGASVDESEYVATSSSLSSPYFSTCTESMIENSKSHWSHLAEFDSDNDEVAEIVNLEAFKGLQRHPTWGDFFQTFGDGEGDFGKLVMGMKFAEGAQAELYEVQVTWSDPKSNEIDVEQGIAWVLKVFKKGTFLRHLQLQWPQGLFQFHGERRECIRLGKTLPVRYNCQIYCATLLEDGRFGFLLRREDEDLRSLIDRNLLKRGHGHEPFPKEVAHEIMYRVALAMDWLYNRGIVHRDVKASNIFVKTHSDWVPACYVGDFECSIGIVGTGFWRAPEILLACEEGNVAQRPELFTKAADVYSYGMTFYEILTGNFPCNGHLSTNYDLILEGHRPNIPKYVDEWASRLLTGCWHPNPAARLSFGEILYLIGNNSSTIGELEQERLGSF